ncbi:MAG: sarcosine oxidase subunit gamma family protein [Alphaproteobacteria bacterium]
MAEVYLRQSPLDHLSLDARAAAEPGEAGVIAGERRFTAKVNLRGDPGDEVFVKAAKTALKFFVPAAPNTVDGKRERYALWLGPDEWLVVDAPGTEAKLVADLRKALDGLHAGVTDVTDGRTVIRLNGPNVRDVLAKGCALDLHPRAFGPARCAQTRLAKATVILHQLDAQTFDVYIERSFADYLWRWIEDAGQEYGFAIVAEPVMAMLKRRRRART